MAKISEKQPYKQKPPVNKTAKASYRITGVDNETVTAHFAKKKVDIIDVKKDVYTFTYTTRGASRKDIERRFELLVKKHDAVYELVENFGTVIV